MPPRPAIQPKQTRPSSAIYIGKGPSPATHDTHLADTPPGLPELPEPPSPSSSIGSVKSGLPSPPATNSTGSGSTGDPATIAIRDRPLSLHSNNSSSTSSGSHPTPSLGSRRILNVQPTHSRHSSTSSITQKGDETGMEADFDDDHDRDNDNDNDNESNFDGDDTARIDRRFLIEKHAKEKENDTLERVKSLAARNRMALDRLSSISRLSPSPRTGTPNSQSPVPSSSSSRQQQQQQPRPIRSLTQISISSPTGDQGRSGSETERESTHHSYSNSTHSSQSSTSAHRPSASMSSQTPPPPATPNHYTRLRHTSAPGSPNKARTLTSGTPQPYSPTRRRHRASMASVSSVQLGNFEEEEDESQEHARGSLRDRTVNGQDLITQSALAAVASSRRSPVSSSKRRAALPREFRSDLVEDSPSPATTGRRSVTERYDDRRLSPGFDKRERWKTTEPVTPFRPMARPSTSTATAPTRSSTMREYRWSGGGPNPRWSSDDFRSPSTLRNNVPSHSHDDASMNRPRERRQSARGGSAESALWSPGGRSLLGEGLRAAGINRRKGDDDPPRSATLRVSTTSSSDVFKDGGRRVDWSPDDPVDESRRRTLRERDGPPPRASTSMADYRYLDRDEEDDRLPREQGLSRHRSANVLTGRNREPSLTRDFDRAPSALGRRVTSHVIAPSHTSSPHLAPQHLQDRLGTSSPFNTNRRFSSQTPAQPAHPQTEHTKLLVDSLTMFETQLAKLPPASHAGGSSGPGLAATTHAELTRNAQAMVYAAERLCSMLKIGAARAVEAEVEAEVDDVVDQRGSGSSVQDVWRRVGGEYRDGGKMSDELVRGMTGFLLGCGRVMRDLSTAVGGAPSEFGSPAVHSRHASLSEDDHSPSSRVRGAPSDVSGGTGSGGGGALSGRRSVASRGSLDPPLSDREKNRQEALKRLAGPGEPGPRPESVLARASPSTFQRLRERDVHTPSRPSVESASTRRSLVSRDTLESKHVHPTPIATLDSQETIHAPTHEPSPTPASRTRPHTSTERSRTLTLTPLNIPKPLPMLPSETRQSTLTPTGAGAKPTPATTRERRRASTIRGTPPAFPVSSTTPTTAVTPHTVSNNATNGTAFPMVRSDSSKSGSSTSATGSRLGSQVTFSKPSSGSVSQTLSHLKGRMSLDSQVEERERERDWERERGDGNRDGRATQGRAVHPADRSAAQTLMPSRGGPSNVNVNATAHTGRERRRTVTDIWPQ